MPSIESALGRNPRGSRASRRDDPCSVGRVDAPQETENEQSSRISRRRFDRHWCAAALAFAKKGAKLVIAGRRDEAGKALVSRRARSAGRPSPSRRCPEDDEVRALVDKTVARFGRLDVAVNNAGTEGKVGPITDQTAESYAATFTPMFSAWS